MAKIFISYRRADTSTNAGRIYDHLTARFGRKNVFKDVDNIPPGVRFPDYIAESIRECAVVLVIIGKHWLESRLPDGQRRLDDPADFVRVETETAFALGQTVIPILVEHAEMPSAAELPESLRGLSLINAISVREDPDFRRDMERMIAAVERAFAASRTGPAIFRRRATASSPANPSAAP